MRTSWPVHGRNVYRSPHSCRDATSTVPSTTTAMFVIVTGVGQRSDLSKVTETIVGWPAWSWNACDEANKQPRWSVAWRNARSPSTKPLWDGASPNCMCSLPAQPPMSAPQPATLDPGLGSAVRKVIAVGPDAAPGVTAGAGVGAGGAVGLRAPHPRRTTASPYSSSLFVFVPLPGRWSSATAGSADGP